MTWVLVIVTMVVPLGNTIQRVPMESKAVCEKAAAKIKSISPSIVFCLKTGKQ